MIVIIMSIIMSIIIVTGIWSFSQESHDHLDHIFMEISNSIMIFWWWYSSSSCSSSRSSSCHHSQMHLTMFIIIILTVDLQIFFDNDIHHHHHHVMMIKIIITSVRASSSLYSPSSSCSQSLTNYYRHNRIPATSVSPHDLAFAWFSIWSPAWRSSCSPSQKNLGRLESFRLKRRSGTPGGDVK